MNIPRATLFIHHVAVKGSEPVSMASRHQSFIMEHLIISTSFRITRSCSQGIITPYAAALGMVTATEGKQR